MRYAITGATGFLGGELARQLREAGHDVVALVRTPSKAEKLTDLGVELVPGDLDNAAALDRLCTGVDGLFHVAGWYAVGVRNGQELGETVNVRGTLNVLDAAQRNNVPKVVYTSTLAINSDTAGRLVNEEYSFTGTHLSHYDRTKAEAHTIAEDFAGAGLPVVIVQPGLIYGPGDTALTGEFIAKVAEGKRPQVPAEGELCWAHVSDVARGHILAMEKGEPGRSYMLAGPRASLAQGLRIVAEAAGTKGPVIVPGAMIRFMVMLTSALNKILPLPAGYHPESLRVATATYIGSAARAEQELGWKARPLEEGLAETVAQLKG